MTDTPAFTTAARTRTIDAGSTFFPEGEPATALFVLDTGSVKLTQLALEWPGVNAW